MGDYHKLEVWQLSTTLADDVTTLIDEMPGRRASAMNDQITRCADSIHQNIAEGCGYNNDRQFAKYLRQVATQDGGFLLSGELSALRSGHELLLAPNNGAGRSHISTEPGHHRFANMQTAIADAATARRYTPDSADYLLTSKWKWIDGAAKAYIADLHGDAAAWRRAVASLDSTSAAVSPRDAPVEAALLEERLATLKASSIVSEHVARADDRAIAAALQVLTADQYPHQFARLMAAKHQLLARTMERAGLSALLDSLQGVTSLPTPFSSGDRADQLRVLGCAHLKVVNDSAAIDAFLRSAALYCHCRAPLRPLSDNRGCRRVGRERARQSNLSRLGQRST